MERPKSELSKLSHDMVRQIDRYKSENYLHISGTQITSDNSVPSSSHLINSKFPDSPKNWSVGFDNQKA